MQFRYLAVFGLFLLGSSLYASPELLNSCMKNMKKATKENCQCLVSQIEKNPNIIKIFKKSKKKYGDAFNQKMMKELKTNWWTGPMSKMPKSKILSDEQGVLLGISMNAVIVCSKDLNFVPKK